MSLNPPRKAYLAASAALQAGGVACADDDQPAKILYLLQKMIISIATSDQAVFDRGQFDRYMGLWAGLSRQIERSDRVERPESASTA